MKRFILGCVVSCMLLLGCATAPSIYEHSLDMLTHAKKPVLVLAISSNSASVFSCTLRDARGKIFVIQDEGLASLRPGMIIQ